MSLPGVCAGPSGGGAARGGVGACISVAGTRETVLRYEHKNLVGMVARDKTAKKIWSTRFCEGI
jgi:hypothetical protein